MTANVPVTPENPYFDDFDQTKKFLRVLFRPGFAVQARELTQMQTGLQDQMSRFADHFFESGTVVVPGETKVDNDYKFVRLSTTLSRSDDNVYIGSTIANAAGTIKAKIVNVKRAEGSDPDTLYIEYLSADSGDETFSQNEQLTITIIEDSGTSTELSTTENASGVTGEGTAVHVEEGTYYISGLFVFVSAQTLIVSKYQPATDLGELSVGLSIETELVTPQDDNSLLDNATGSPNETAPGAHRLKIDPVLSLKDDVSNQNNFIELVKLNGGDVEEKARRTQYTVIEETLARRTFDESGDYVIDDFVLSLKEHLNDGSNNGAFTAANGGDETKIAIELDPGRAYVRGFEIDSQINRVLATDKARTTETAEDIFIPMQLGNYILVDEPTELPVFHQQITFKEGATSIGTGYVRALTTDLVNSAYRLYIFSTNFDSGKSLADVDSVEDTATSFQADINASGQNSGGETLAFGTSNNQAVFEIPFGVISDVTAGQFSRFEKFANKVVSGTEVTLTTTGKQFKDETTDYVVETQNGRVGRPTNVSVNVGAGNTEVTLTVDDLLDVDGSTISNATDNGHLVTVYANLRVDDGNIKTKTTNTRTITALASNPQDRITLDRADVFEIVSILDTATGTVDYTDNYTLDTGQRDNFYDLGKVNIRDGFPEPGEDVDIRFRFYSHGNGDYFVAQSYGDTNFDDIPIYTTSSGDDIRLSNAIDFRPRINNNGLNFQGSTVQFEPDSEIQTTFDYFLGRKDKLVLDKNGNFKIVKGVPEREPEFPPDIQDSVTLYRLTIPPYTYDVGNIEVKKIDHRRFTMKDIGEIERRVENLEYYTTLSLLEADTINKAFVDKFKSGFIVDSFESQQVSDSSNPNLRIAIDLEKSEARPEASTKNLNLELDAGSSSGYVINNNVVTLPYTEKTVVDQPLASRLERLNPFIKYSWRGSVSLSPSSDTWLSTNRRPDLTLDGGTLETARFRNARGSFGTIWGGWRTLWTGVQRSFGQTATDPITVQSTSTQVRQGVLRRPVTRTQTQFVGDRIVSVSAAPWIRSRPVTFTATGLKPSARIYPFFDGVDVSDHVTPNPLVADGAGNLTGTFTIPNNDDLRFRTGVRRFKLTSNADNSENPQTSAETRYAATGTVQSRQRQFITTRIRDVETDVLSDRRTLTTTTEEPSPFTPVQRRRIWSDPLAQSFVIENESGVFLTSIDLYFGETANSNTDPVRVQIREMINGFPGPSVIPFSNVLVPAGSIAGSADATTVTNVAFEAPVFLEQNREYCFVLLTNSPVLDLWTARLGENTRESGDVVNNSGRQITKQGFLGSLFKSQNNTTWTADQTADIKFKLNRAVFNTSTPATVTLKNETLANDVGTEADPHLVTLGDRALETTNGSDFIKVHHYSHSFVVGDSVTLTGNAVNVNGVPHGEIYTTHTVVDNADSGDSIDVDYYYVQVSTSASQSGLGGTGVTATQNVGYSTAHFQIEEIDFNKTSADWSFTGFGKFTGSTDASATPVLINEDVRLKVPRTAKSSGDGRVQLVGTLSTTVDNLSPVVDLDRTSMIAIENRINNREDDNLVASSAKAAARYISKPVPLANPANELRVLLDVSRPSGSSVDVFYKAASAGSDIPFSQEVWTKMTADDFVGANDSFEDFSEYEYTADVGFDFSQVSVKVVLRSADEAKVPRLASFRAIALKDESEL